MVLGRDGPCNSGDGGIGLRRCVLERLNWRRQRECPGSSRRRLDCWHPGLWRGRRSLSWPGTASNGRRTSGRVIGTSRRLWDARLSRRGLRTRLGCRGSGQSGSSGYSRAGRGRGRGPRLRLHLSGLRLSRSALCCSRLGSNCSRLVVPGCGCSRMCGSRMCCSRMRLNRRLR